MKFNRNLGMGKKFTTKVTGVAKKVAAPMTMKATPQVNHAESAVKRAAASQTFF
jgi:hypothetical protein